MKRSITTALIFFMFYPMFNSSNPNPQYKWLSYSFQGVISSDMCVLNQAKYRIVL